MTWHRVGDDAGLTETARLVPRGASDALEQNAIVVLTELPDGARLPQGPGLRCGTPADRVECIQKESAAAVGTPALRERLPSRDALPCGRAPAAFASDIAAEPAKRAKVVKASGAKVD